MELTKDKLLEMRNELLLQLEEAQTQVAAVNGALSLIDQQIKLLEKEVKE
jgi:hypothetical protein